MVDVFVCHTAGDRAVAEAMRARLERGAECTVRNEDCGGEPVTEVWDSGLPATAIVVILSRESVPKGAGRAEWGNLLEHVERNETPPVGCMVVGECKFPPLLSRAKMFRWENCATETLRAMERWVLSLHGDARREGFTPAAVSGQGEHKDELDLLWSKLVDGAGTASLDCDEAWAVAQEFARAAGDHFREVIWVDCEGRAEDAVLGEIATELETLPETVPDVVAAHRMLVVLDGVEGEPALTAPVEGRGSVLVTRPRADAEGDPAPGEPAEQKLWAAARCCRRGRFAIDLAREISGLGAEEARRAAERLFHPLDLKAGLYRRAATEGDIESGLRRRHAEAVANSLGRDTCRRDLAELDTALPWALENDWELAKRMGRRACRFLESAKRQTEAARVYKELIRVAQERGDAEEAEYCKRELSWIEGISGRGPVDHGEQLSLF